MLNYFPKYYSNRAIIIYLLGLIFISVFFKYAMSWLWWLFGIVSVLGFFYFSNKLTKEWQNISTKYFVKKIFITAFIIRLIWVVFSYFLYLSMTGQPFEFASADAMGYDLCALDISENLKRGNWSIFKIYMDMMGVSDSGYISYLGMVYYFFGDSIIIARLLKAFYSALTCILIYKLTSRTFSEPTGRMSAIFCMLMPNLIYYCGLHLKETEMVFLTVAFIERSEYAMRSAKFTFSNLILPILLAGSLFFFRTVLGATALFSFFTALIFAPGRILKGWKRIILAFWVILTVFFFLGGRISTEVEEVWESRKTNQSSSMEWRSKRKGGNEFAKYASASVFAPMILVIPFPTMIDIEHQSNQQLLHGGYYVKNIIAFFAMVALLWILKNKKWRDYSLIVSFVLGYLIIIAFSAFAHSERFHLPALPFVLVLAAFGVTLSTNKTKKYYMFYLAFIFIALVVWNWFKLLGRGLV